jgi:hypothetical protein
MTRSTTILPLVVLVSTLQVLAEQAEPWTPQNVAKACDRSCLEDVATRYIDAMIAQDPGAVPPLDQRYRMTENTGRIEVGEGLLWRSRIQRTPFLFFVADPVAGQVAAQGRIQFVGGGGASTDALVAIRLRVERDLIHEIEHLWLRGVDPAAIPLLTTPVSVLTGSVPAEERISRDAMLRVAHSYFDALESDDGRVGAFADDCIRHENGYQTVNNPSPGGRLMPGPALPDSGTPQGREQLRASMLTCSEQISEGMFSFITRIRPRRVLILDEEKQVVSAFPLFVMDGTRRGAPDAPPGMLQNMVTMETFAVRGGQIHHVEVFPFVTFPYGLGDGWTPLSGR